MALFQKDRQNEVVFNKETVLAEIIEILKGMPNWHYFKDIDQLDLLLIHNVDIREEISSDKNPFSQYKKITDAHYQIVIAVTVADVDEKITIDTSGWTTSHIVVDSAKAFNRILKNFKLGA